MRSVQLIPGDPWPWEMSIVIDDRPSALLDLLWVREAHALDVGGDDGPPPLTHTPEPATVPLHAATRSAAEKAWSRIWRAAAEHAGREVDNAAIGKLHSAGLSESERDELLRSVVGSTWEDEFGNDVFDEPAYQAWKQSVMEGVLERHRRGVVHHQERRDVDALVPAWRAGLTKIVAIPCRGDYSRPLGAHGLLITGESRDDSERYRAALRSLA